VAAPESKNAASRVRGAMMRHEVFASGALSGIAGGVAMVGVAGISAAAQGLAPEYALRIIGESFVAPEALDGAAKAAFGALVHLATAAALGVLFAGLVARDFPTTCAMGAGVGFALFTLGLMMSLVVPWANPGFRAGMQAIGGAWVIAHAIFGLTLGLAPALRRRLARDAADAMPRAAAQTHRPVATGHATAWPTKRPNA
jgi:hypothetical protein